MAGQLTIWGTTQRDIEPILKEIGIENVDVYNGAEPPIMTNGVLFVVGSQTIPKMANLGVVPKGRTITSLRVNTYELRTNKVRFSYSPSIKNIDSGMFTDLKNDLVLAYRLAMTGSLEPKLGKYKYVEDFSDYCNQLQVLEKEGNKNIPITFDTETIGFDYLHLGDNTRPQARFVSFQLSIKKGESHVVYFKDFGSMSQWLTKNASQLIYLFTDKNLSMGGANFKFDLNWLRHFTGLYCTNFKFDTTLVGSLLDENRSNSLDNHTKIYVPDLGGYADSFNATYDKGRMDLIPQDILLPYAGGDTDACFQVRQRMTLLLKEQPNLANFYINILHPSARAFEELEYQGVYIDRDRYFEVERDLNDEIKNCIHQAVKCIGGRLYAIHKDPKKVGGINIGKASLIEDYLFSPKGLNLKPKMLTEKTGKPVTSAQHLQMFLDVPEARPFIEAFLNYNKASKALSTYVTGFLKHQRSDGRFHPSYFLFAGDKTLGDGGTSCLTGNQLVFTNRGYITVNEIKVGDLVISHTGKPRAIVDKFENGIKPIHRVTLSNGLVLDTTGNHPYYVHGFEDIYTWVNADKLQVGNKVATYHDAEVWKPIEGWSDYEVSSIGRVRNVKTGKILKTYPKGKWGHRKLSLKRNTPKQRGEDYKDFSIHRLVAKAFLGEQSKLEVCHKNGIAWDNRAENLKYATSKENTQDAIRHGTALGRNIRDLKLSEEKVKFIRETTTEQGYSSTKLAERFGVSPRYIRRIRQGDRWKDYELQEQSVEFKNAEVVSIELLEPEMTYGLTVDVDHSHVTNGIVTHNTGRLSAHNPAFQCTISSTSVIVKGGNLDIIDIVESFETGNEIEVLTHTGEYKKVIGVYRNGIKPVYKVTLSDGKSVTCTGNHPLLTVNGFSTTSKLTNTDKVFTYDCENLERNRNRYESKYANHLKERKSWEEVFSLGEVRLRYGEDDTFINDCRQDTYCILWMLQKVTLNNAWKLKEKTSDKDLLGLATHEIEMLQSKRQGIQELWWSWDKSMRELVKFLRYFFIRYGGETARSIFGQARCEWELRACKLQMGDSEDTSKKQKEYYISGLQWCNEIFSKYSRGEGLELLQYEVKTSERLDFGKSTYHAYEAELAGFNNSKVISISYVGEQDTFDLTVEGSRSYVGNGIVMHNTLPKKGDWGKRLRKCFTAPEGYLVTEKDYSQGELRVIACVADEKTMLNAYKQGRDLHIQTGSGLGGITYEQMLALKDTDPDKFDSLRKNAKPANFGLCLHENSQVLTKNKVTNIIKTVRIADIQECHLVWDGVEWVSHDGIIYKGYHEVIIYQGVTATPCHEVFTHELGKVTLYEATITNANIIETARGKTPITCGGDIYFESGDSSADVEGNKRLVLRPRKRELLFLWGEGNNRKLSRRKSLLNLGLFDLSLYGTPSDDVHIKKSKQAISARQYESDKCKGKRKDPSRTLHRRLPKSISELEYVQSIAKLSSVQKRHLKKLGIQVYKAKVYDILNAGERHRFTADGKLVSNCYGMGANGYMTYAKNNYGVDMTLEEAEQIRHAFLYETYPMLPIYHERYKEIARKTGKIISPLGRVRHLPLINSRDSMVRSGAERQAVNSAIQSTLSDMLCWAMAISHQRGHTKYAPCFGAIHDATYNYVPEDDWEKWTLADKEIMETLPFEKVGWKPQLEFVADAKIGKSMGELYDLEDFKKEN